MNFNFSTNIVQTSVYNITGNDKILPVNVNIGAAKNGGHLNGREIQEVFLQI